MTTTQYLTVDPQRLDPATIQTAANCLRDGGLVAFPTETVYGLGANALDADAVEKIFTAKGRPNSDPIILHIAELDQLEQIAVDVPPLTQHLAERFWAGALTLVLKRHERVPGNVAAGLPTVAVRMPSHPVALSLIRAAGVPIAAPSANLFAHPSPTTAAHVRDDLDGRIDIILDGGRVDIGIESTILDLTQTPPVVLRPGGVTVEALRDLIPDLVVEARYLRDDDQPTAPGMLSRHYAPRGELRLYTGDAETAIAAIKTEIRRLQAEHEVIYVGLLTVKEEQPHYIDVPVMSVVLGSLHDMEAVAHNLFAGLRELDQLGMQVIFARSHTRDGLGLAVWDRLVRAAEGRVIDVDARSG